MSLEKEFSIQVTLSGDGMQAYMFVIEPVDDTPYTATYLQEKLMNNGVIAGILTGELERIVEEKLYGTTVLVAQGKSASDGTDGYYEYDFNRSFDNTPQIREDGTVDYWSMNLIETVITGQVIAIYKPAVQGQGGYTVRGVFLASKHAKEQAPLKGKGFERSNDNLTYIASMDGKIEMKNGRITITALYEVFGNADLSTGNLHFSGDILIHGNVCAGVSVKAGGTLTVDGIVEGATIWAGKDIIFRSGVLGDRKAYIFSKGNIYAKFFEYTKVESYGDMEANVFLKCEVNCRGNIVLTGKRGRIIGGEVRAIRGIEAEEIGNIAEVTTNVAVGVEQNKYQQMKVLNSNIEAYQRHLKDIEKGIHLFDEAEKTTGKSYKEDPRRMRLLRTKIRENALAAADKAELDKLIELEKQAQFASIKVNHTIYAGVRVEINNAKVYVKEEKQAVEFVRRGELVVLRREDIVV